MWTGNMGDLAMYTHNKCNWKKKKQDKQNTYNVTLRRVRETITAVEKQ